MTDTTEVISLLSLGSLELLRAETPEIQGFVVQTITAAVAYWETQHVVLDPITREAVLDSLVAIHIATATGFANLILAAKQEHDASCDR